ncbi:MAG: hypothetical protein P8X42_13820, partial [Calditrichaceae bacterium]
TNFGLEYGFRDFVFLRGGYNIPIFPSDYPEDEEYQYGLNLGFGLNIDVAGNKVVFDYAYRDMDLFSSINYFTIGLEF